MKIIKVKELSRGYKVVLTQTYEAQSLGEFDLYDIDVLDRNGGTVVTTSHGCIGEKSGEYWMESAIQYMQRLLLLVDARDTAYNNLLCYSKTYAMDTPKDGCEDNWQIEKDKANMIEKWLIDHSEYFGKENTRKYQIQVEFDIHEIFCD